MMGAAGAISTLPSQTLFARASKVAHGRALRGLEAMLSSQCCMQTMLQPTSCRLSARDAQAQDLIIRRAQHAQASCSSSASGVQRLPRRQRRAQATQGSTFAEPQSKANPVTSSTDRLQPCALAEWLRKNGAPEQKAVLSRTELPGENLLLRAIAAQDLSQGEVVLSIPEHSVITLDRVLEDEAVTELLTTGKLSELALLTLYLMYEKKRGRQSVWQPFIQALDRQRGRGQQGAKSPLLWDPGQAERLLAGSPVLADLHARLVGIEKEYDELDTVWFMAGSLFRNYPFQPPSEAFSFPLFLQGFAAVQAAVVHLQGVPLAKRFAIVPMGPPLLTYSSAMLRYDAGSKNVQLVSDRAYDAGQDVLAWCGPQPNRRLLINYGFVDENNPHDRVALTVTLPQNDPLFQLKRSLLQRHGMSTQQTFQLARGQKLPHDLFSYMRLAHTCDEADAREAAGFQESVMGTYAELTALEHLTNHLQQRLARYPTSIAEDDAVVADRHAGAREKVAARLVRIEKAILQDALKQVNQIQLPAPTAGAHCVVNAIHLS